MSKPYTMDDVRAWVEMRWGRERLDEKVMARIRATVEERDALKAQVADLEAEVVSWRATARDKGESSRKAAAERDALRAQVEAARALCRDQLDHGKVEADDLAGRILDAMDEAARDVLREVNEQPTDDALEHARAILAKYPEAKR